MVATFDVEPHVIPPRVECHYCQAQLFISEVESESVCCKKGKLFLQPREPPRRGDPAYAIHMLWRDPGSKGKLMRQYGRVLNSALALASQTSVFVLF